MNGTGESAPVVPPLNPAEVHVWHASLEPNPQALERMAATLAPDETQRAARFRHDIHRNRYIAGRGILRALLGAYLDCPPHEVAFRYGQCGKPALTTGTLRFNASHSASKALFAFARDRELGVDIERIQDRKELLKIAEHFFAKGEVAALAALTPEAQRDAFYRCWTRKEAYLKAKGDGLSLALGQFEVSLAPDEPARLVSAEGDPLEPSRWDMASLNIVEGYASALVIAVPCGAVRVLEWEAQS